MIKVPVSEELYELSRRHAAMNGGPVAKFVREAWMATLEFVDQPTAMAGAMIRDPLVKRTELTRGLVKGREPVTPPLPMDDSIPTGRGPVRA